MLAKKYYEEGIVSEQIKGWVTESTLKIEQHDSRKEPKTNQPLV